VPDWLIDLCNRINDTDLTWVGFRRLRPAADQDMSARVVALLCLFYCPLCAVLALGITYFTYLSLRHRAPAAVPWVVAAAAAVLFLLMQCALAYAWNHRAAQRRAGKKSP
jgi:hypothetical protein